MNPKETLKKPCKYHMKVYIVKYLWGVAHVLWVTTMFIMIMMPMILRMLTVRLRHRSPW